MFKACDLTLADVVRDNGGVEQGEFRLVSIYWPLEWFSGKDCANPLCLPSARTARQKSISVCLSVCLNMTHFPIGGIVGTDEIHASE